MLTRLIVLGKYSNLFTRIFKTIKINGRMKQHTNYPTCLLTIIRNNKKKLDK